MDRRGRDQLTEITTPSTTNGPIHFQVIPTSSQTHTISNQLLTRTNSNINNPTNQQQQQLSNNAASINHQNLSNNVNNNNNNNSSMSINNNNHNSNNNNQLTVASAAHSNQISLTGN